jgi:hypothetical protein
MHAEILVYECPSQAVIFSGLGGLGFVVNRPLNRHETAVEAW